jgi:hypothetical protein
MERSEKLKMKRVFFYLQCSVVVLVMFTSCKKEGNGVMNYTMKSDGFESRITWDSCITNISGLTFSASLKNDQINKNSQTTPQKVNILTPSSIPYNTGDLDPGKYKDVRVILSYTKSVLNNPFTLYGKYHGTTGEPVELQIYINENIELVTKGNDFSLDKDEYKTATISVNMQTLMSTISNTELTNAIHNGKIIISLDPNKDLHDKILAKLPEATSTNF